MHGHATLAGCKRKALMRRMEHLLEASRVTIRLEGRRRQLSTAYSTCVAAVCYLLKAGLSETVVSVLAH